MMPSVEKLPPTQKDGKKIWLRLGIFIAVFIGGFLVCYCFFARERIVEKIREVPVGPIVVQEPKPWGDFDLEVEKRTNAKVIEMLKNLHRSLRIKDHEALTVSNRIAAIGAKTVDNKNTDLTQLTYGFKYPIYAYSVRNGFGRGVAYDGYKELFWIEWEPGATKPPPTNPGSFRVIKGVIIEAP